MPPITIDTILEKYPFLDEHTAREPFLFDVLNEIVRVQKEFEKGRIPQFATRTHVFTTPNIKMPITPSRDKNLLFILAHLRERYPDYIASMITFEFNFNDKTKKLVVEPVEEFCYALAPGEIDRLQRLRDQTSLENFLALIGKFRTFNLTKLLKLIIQKKDFARVLQSGVNKSFFVYKNSEVAANKIMPEQEFCFHSKNYQSVKSSLSMNQIRSVIVMNNDMIKKRLEKFGIMNTDISDYSDKKVDYILHILTTDLANSLSPKDLTETQNFKSLRDCIVRVDKNLDPANLHHANIVKFIRENTMATVSDIAAGLATVEESAISKWASNAEVLKKEYISKTDDGFGQLWLVSTPAAPAAFSALYSLMKNEPEKFDQQSSFEKKTAQKKIEILVTLLSSVVQQNDAPTLLKSPKEKVSETAQLIEDYRTWIQQRELRTELSSNEVPGRRLSLMEIIADFISSLFLGAGAKKSRRGSDSGGDVYTESAGGPAPKKIAGITRAIYTKASVKNQPIMALSDFIVLSKENDRQVETIIREFEENNLKIVIPVFNARTALYPVRSAKLLIPDIEYLLVDPAVVITSESVTAYIDSLVGVKLHDDFIPGSTLSLIEKYLRNIYRQKKNRMKMQSARSQKKR